MYFGVNSSIYSFFFFLAVIVTLDEFTSKSTGIHQRYVSFIYFIERKVKIEWYLAFADLSILFLIQSLNGRCQRDTDCCKKIYITHTRNVSLGCLWYHKLFCVFGDFYASGTQDAEVTKSLPGNVVITFEIMIFWFVRYICEWIPVVYRK